jgi:hypothetical protein
MWSLKILGTETSARPTDTTQQADKTKTQSARIDGNNFIWVPQRIKGTLAEE